MCDVVRRPSIRLVLGGLLLALAIGWLVRPAVVPEPAGPALVEGVPRREDAVGGPGSSQEVHGLAADARGRDRDVGADRAPAWQVRAPDGTPAAGARLVYRPLDRPELSYEGTACADGSVPVDATVLGDRCEVNVRASDCWAPCRFDLFAVGRPTLTLAAGCEVWLALGGEHLHLTGRAAHLFSPGSGSRRVVLSGESTFLGRFLGSLTITHVGDTRAGASLENVLLPTDGRVTLAFAPRPVPPPCRLRFRAPAGAGSPPSITLADVQGVSESVEDREPRRAPEPDVVELVVSPGHYTVLGSCAERWAFAEVEARPSDAAEEVPLTWEAGCDLEVRWPVEPPWSAGIELLSDPRPPHGRALPRLESDVDSTPGELHLDRREVHGCGGRWPGLARRDGPQSSVWPGLPRGAHVRVALEDTPWGRLVGDASIPLQGDRHVLEVRPGASFRVQAASSGGSVPDRLFLTIRPVGERSFEAHDTWTVQGAATVTGVQPGTQVHLTLVSAAWRGEATVTVRDGLVAEVPVLERASALYRARVVDPEGRPLPALGVSFGSHRDFGRVVQSDADGWAETRVASDRTVYASSAAPGWTSPLVPVAPGGAGTVVARPERQVDVVFDLGDRAVQVCEDLRGEDGASSSTSTLHVLPGSRYVVALRPGVERLRLTVRPADAVPAGGEVPPPLFDEEVDLRPSGRTELVVRSGATARRTRR